jgi:hypothetical protein
VEILHNLGFKKLKEDSIISNPVKLYPLSLKHLSFLHSFLKLKTRFYLINYKDVLAWSRPMKLSISGDI